MRETIMEEPPAEIKGKVTPVKWNGICYSADINKGLKGKHNHNANTG